MAQTSELARLRDAWRQFSEGMYGLGQDDAKAGLLRRSENFDYLQGYNAALPELETCTCGDVLCDCAGCPF